MKLSTYIKSLNGVKKEHGGDLEVITSADAEGNSFDKIFYAPTVGTFADSEFDDCPEGKPNSVCVN